MRMHEPYRPSLRNRVHSCYIIFVFAFCTFIFFRAFIILYFHAFVQQFIPWLQVCFNEYLLSCLVLSCMITLTDIFTYTLYNRYSRSCWFVRQSFLHYVLVYVQNADELYSCNWLHCIKRWSSQSTVTASHQSKSDEHVCESTACRWRNHSRLRLVCNYCDFSICGALEKHLLTYLLAYLLCTSLTSLLGAEYELCYIMIHFDFL